MSLSIAAAGGVLWRPAAGAGIEVAVVHRPRYDDWSLPKGKLGPHEQPLLGALREVAEETGHAAVPGRRLGTSAYEVLQDGRLLPKTVRWWAMRAGAGTFTPGPEVDRLRWVAPAETEHLLTAGRDRGPVRLLAASGTWTTTVVLVRHGKAGDRASWPGDDLLRPLDERGRAQAERLAAVLPAYAPVRVLSAPAERCRQTVEPLAAALGLQVEQEPLVGEEGYAKDPELAVARVADLGRAGAASVVCSQGGALPEIVSALAEQAGLDLRTVKTRKGSAWALTFARGRLVDADHVPPLA